VAKAGDTMTGQLALVGDPAAAAHAARKQYVDDKFAAVPSPIPTGTAMLFPQATTPVGWTKQTTHDNKALRIVSGTPASGGSVAFSTLFGRTSTDGFTMTSAYNGPDHPIILTAGKASVLGSAIAGVNPWGKDGSYASETTYVGNLMGGGAAHSHPIDMRVQYVDVMIAIKN